MSRSPGESRIPTVRRSGLPRPTSGTSPQYHLTYATPPFPLPQPYDTSREIIANPAHLQRAPYLQAGVRGPPVKAPRISEGDPEGGARRNTQRQGSAGYLGFQYGSVWGEEDRSWGRDTHEGGIRGLKASTESAFSRQLARITRGSDEDLSESCLTYRVRNPRSCWDGPPLHQVAAAAPPPELPSTSLTRDSLGKRVVVGGAEHGTLRYYGRTAFSSGEWCGVELERPVGKNDGSVDGVIYFSCRPGHGIFAPAAKVTLDPDYIHHHVAALKSWNTDLMPSTTLTQEAPVRRRPSDASTATYTVEGRDGSLPTSPDSQQESPSSTRPRELDAVQGQGRRSEDRDEDLASLGSPEDATCDESSLGILTPDQMPDFTVTASASLGRSPSDEDVAALEDEVCEGGAEGGGATALVRWESDPSIAVVDEELFKQDVSAIIRELRTSAEVSSSSGSSPTRPHPSPETQQFQQDEQDLQEQQEKEDQQALLNQQQQQEAAARAAAAAAEEEEEEEEVQQVVAELRGAPMGVTGRRVAPLATRVVVGGVGSEVSEGETVWAGSAAVAAAAMTTSAGSLDQGYQGDAECDPRSEGGTGTASSPTEDVRLFEGVIDVERLTGGDASLADDEGEADPHNGVAARDRTARIIDGKLYHSHRELARPHDPSSEMDSSGFYSDLDPRERDPEDESGRTDLEPVQEALGMAANMHDSLLDHDHTLDDHSMQEDQADDQAGSVTVDDEEGSWASTLRPESKDATSSEAPDVEHSPQPEGRPHTPSPPTTASCDSPHSVKEAPPPDTEPSKLTDSGIAVEEAEDPSKAAPQPKPRTYDKPWLSRPPPPKKKEEPRRPLPPPPPMPKKNVQSKLKALLEAQEPVNEDRRPRQPRKNRWDDVMNKIAEGQREDKARPKVREVRSRLMEGVLTQAQMSPQAERIRQERRERRERRERQAAVAAVAARRASQASRLDRKRSCGSTRSNRTSRAPSLDSLPADPSRGSYSRASTPDHSQASNKSYVDKAGPRPTSPCPSDVSTSSGQSQASTMSRVSTRLPIRALHASGPAHSGSVASLCSTTSGGGGSRGSRDPRVASSTTSTTTTTTTTATTARQNGASVEKKRVEGVSAPPRRPRLDNIKSTIPKPGRLPPRNNTDPVKAARPGGGNGPRGPLVGHNGPAHQEQQQQQQQHPAPHADQLRRLEAEVAARVAEARAARSEREETTRGLEALTVLLHHLTTTYDPFSTPRLKAEVVRLSNQLTEARLNLDESTAAVRRAQDEAKSREEQHQQDIQQLHQQHQQALEVLRQQHKQEIDLALEKHRKELAQFAEDQETQRAEVSRAHTAELEQLEGEWRNKLDIQHEKHLCALQDLNTQHTHKLRELESSRRARERELEEANFRLSQDQEALRQESRKLQETLLNDTDHRLMAVRKMCTSLKSEVDSLKTVVDMKNTEIHELRGRVVETERLGGELEAARERVRALQAKTEDLQAQMEKRVQQERHLVNEHRLLLETFQRESNTNKRLSLENEELAWKLRQREEIMSTSMPSSTLDLVSRAGPPRHQEGAASPQAAPRSPRVAVRSPSGKISPSKCDAANKQRRSRLGLSSEDGERGEKLQQQEVSFESPPPSPCVKAVVEKSNSVSFILDLNDSQSDDSFLDLPPSPRPRPQRTASLSAADRPRTPTHIRRVIHNNRANSLNRNGTHGDAKPKDFTRKPKEVNGKGKDQHEKPSKDMNGKSLEINGRPSSRRTTSESSEGGSEVERISPTGMAWTVPVHQPKSPVKIPPPLNGSPVRKRIEHHLLEDPEEDEYEETPSGTHQFIEVVGLTSSSEAASDSELSQCDIKEESSTDSDSDSSDGERLQEGNLGHKSGPWCPKEGAGEAMITDELLKQYTGDQNTVEVLPRAKRNGRRRIPSAPSSDSDENVTPHNEGNNDVSWSEDVDITSSSEMHEL